MIRRVCLASKTCILTFQRLNIKGVDQFVRIHKIVCTYVVGMHKVRMLFFAVGQYSLQKPKCWYPNKDGSGELAEMFNLDWYVSLIWFFTSHQQYFSHIWTGLPGWTSTKVGIMFLFKDTTPVKLGPVAPRSRVKHSTTEPLRSWLRLSCLHKT